MNGMMWFALNALNFADAGLTVAAIRLGLAEEGNPVVLAIGWEAKLLGVILLSTLLYKLRPKLLVVPLFAYSLVVVYTAAAIIGG